MEDFCCEEINHGYSSLILPTFIWQLRDTPSSDASSDFFIFFALGHCHMAPSTHSFYIAFPFF